MVLIVCLHMSVHSMNTTVCRQATERATLCGNIVNACEIMSLFSPEMTKFLIQILCPAYLGVSRETGIFLLVSLFLTLIYLVD